MRSLLLLTLLFCGPALAVPVCVGSDAAEPSAIEREAQSAVVDAASLDAEAVSANPIAEETLVLPCATAEGGFFGALCVEATVYIVTDAGVVLCNVQVPPVNLDLEAPTQLQDHSPPGSSKPLPSGPIGVGAASCSNSAPARGPSSLRLSAPCHRVFAYRDVAAEPPLLPG